MQTPFAYFPNQKMLFIGSKASFISKNEKVEAFDFFLETQKGNFIFSAIAYDLKNQFENVSSSHVDVFDFPDILAFVPEQVIDLSTKIPFVLFGISQLSDFTDNLIKTILKHQEIPFPTISISPSLSKKEYLKQVDSIQTEIQYGNCYELNFCQEYVAKEVEPFDTLGVFLNLYKKTKSPFSVYFHFDTWEVMCLSPERYLQKIGNKLISQPIKGTIRRGKDQQEDIFLQNKLKTDSKEKSENVMIVDLVRNDLSKIAEMGSVKVEELFGIYKFETLHHMISTISCEVKTEITLVECLKATFPMGSMTGAPKKKVMEIIEKHESFKRGLYSGSIGYILPTGDFDFNVVIRTLFYNNILKTLSCAVGSAITIKAIAENEYEECEVKVGNLIRSFK